MKAQLFEIAILWHPTDKQIKDDGAKTKLLAGPKTLLAKDQNAAQLSAAMEIPAEYKEQLDQIQIAIRPF